MNTRRKKKIIRWSVFYLCLILAVLLVVHVTGNKTTQVIAADQSGSEKTTENKSESVVAAVEEDESGMVYLQADANGTLTGADAGETLPVAVKVTYYLDGKQISAADIAGKSGTVKIRFDYENQVEKTVKVEDKDITVKVPFMLLSAVVMPSDIFSNVEVANGKVMTEEDENIAVGTAFPGLKESLSLGDYENTKDIDLADYVEITAEAKDFELSFTANIIASLGMDELDTANLDDVDELVDNMDELGDASAALAEGTGTLLGGMQTYQTAVTSYTEGTEQLQSGIHAINAAVARFSDSSEDGTEAAMGAAKALAADAASLAAGMSNLQTGIGAVQTFAQEVYGYEQAVEAAKANASADVNAVQDAVNGADSAATAQAREQMQNSIADIKNQITACENLTEEEKASLQTSMDSIINNIVITGTMGDAANELADIQAQLDTIPAFSIPSLSVDTDSIQTALKDMQTQLGVLAGFSESMTGLSEGITQLATSLHALETGASQLTAYNEQLVSGIRELVDGTGTLQEGMDTLDQEGIQKIKDLSNDDLLTVVNRVKALKEAEADYKKENAGADGEAKSYVVETAEIVVE